MLFSQWTCGMGGRVSCYFIHDAHAHKQSVFAAECTSCSPHNGLVASGATSSHVPLCCCQHRNVGLYRCVCDVPMAGRPQQQMGVPCACLPAPPYPQLPLVLSYGEHHLVLCLVLCNFYLTLSLPFHPPLAQGKHCCFFCMVLCLVFRPILTSSGAVSW